MKRVLSVCLLSVSLAAAGCGGNAAQVGPTSAAECSAPGSNVARYVANTVTLPKSKHDDAIDLDGDGRPDNALGNILGALSTYFNTQMSVDEQLANGKLILLMDVKSSDASFSTDACAGADVYVGRPVDGKPDFSGAGTFVADSSAQGGTFSGALSNGSFDSADPVTAKTPVSVTLDLPLVPNGKPIQLSVVAAHLQFKRAADGSISSGAIQGAIREKDVQGTIIPAVANLLNDKLQADPNKTDGQTNQIRMFFDQGGTATMPTGCLKSDGVTPACKNPDGTCAKDGDNRIDVCEISTSPLINAVLSPDVQLFSDDGQTYMPHKGMHPDALSLGLGFTGVKANF